MNKEQAMAILRNAFPNDDPEIYSENEKYFGFSIDADDDGGPKIFDSQMRVINRHTGEISKIHVRKFLKGE